jgi:stage II sporulation protein D
VGCRGGELAVFDGVAGDRLGLDAGGRSVLVVPVGTPAGEETTEHRVQVASFRAERDAQSLAIELERSHAEPADAYWEPSRGVWRVRIGRARSPERLRELLGALRGGGFPDAWVVRETSSRLADGRLRVLDAGWDAYDAPAGRLVFASSGDGLVTVDGRAYRGVVEVAVTASGRLAVINELNLEQYLRGVVPEELGPAAFPELEALKAQAVAARTYAVGNLGQFSEDGYDICDTPRCQAYGGADSEHPLSDRAVRETSGLILEHAGRPINAMYTSTCGGHTEDVEVVFPDLEGAYLRGVACSATERQLSRLGFDVRGRRIGPGPGGASPDAGVLGLARLVADGLVGPEAWEEGWRAEIAPPAETGALIRELAGRSGRGAQEAAAPGGRTRLDAWIAWARMFDDAGSTAGLVPPDSIDLVLAYRDAGEIPAEFRAAVANLLAMGIVAPRAGGTLDVMAAPTRDEVLGWMARTADRSGVAAARAGEVVGHGRGAVELRVGRTIRTFRLEPAPDLLLEHPEGWSRAESVRLQPGDRVLFVAAGAAGEQSLALVAVRQRKSRTDDRMSSKFRWETVKERGEIERSLADVAPVGMLTSLQILRRGVSGRVAELRLEGTEGEAVVRGFALRRALGLPETLFDLDVQQEADGVVRRVTFRGRGWGHGVGMCQYGAYGRARRGEDFRRILEHYYSDVRLRRWSPG